MDVPDAENAEAAHAALLDEANPFLAKLLGTYLPKDSAANAAAKGIATNVSEVEAALRSRMEGTMRAASQVLQALENGAVAGGSAASSAKEPQLAALNNLLRAENARLRDQTVQDAVKVRELQSSLADKEEELLVEKRKLVQLKEAAAVAPPATQPSQNEDGAVKAEVKPEADGNVGGPSPVDGAQAERLGRQVERLVADVEARDAALSKAER